MIKKLSFIFLLTGLSQFPSFGQNPLQTFDFWIGTWETSMPTAPNWDERKGIDSVRYLLNNTLIEEVFTKVATGKSNFQRGYLTYLRRERRWKHTIYDSKWGEYTFYGKKEGDKIVLISDPKSTRPGWRRETFYNITKDGFDYLWEGSYDNGKTWREEWKVSYKRKS